MNNKSNNNKSKSKPSAQPALPSDYFDMPYKTFLRLCLQFQLRNHEKYLATFRASFLFHDGDNDGILNTTEFRYSAVAATLFNETYILRFVYWTTMQCYSCASCLWCRLVLLHSLRSLTLCFLALACPSNMLSCKFLHECAQYYV